MKRHAILLINNVPYFFPEAFIESESYSIGSDIQLPTKRDDPPIITPSFRTAKINVALPAGEWKNRMQYKTAREVIRLTQFMFAQRHNFLNGHGDVASTDENSTDALGNKLNIPFTNLQVPWEIQISCAYFGLNIQLACCILSSFSISSNPRSSTTETWNIGLTEYDISRIRGNPETLGNKPGTVDRTQTFVHSVL